MIRTTLTMIALLALAACGAEVTAPADFLGRYELETLNAKKLPVDRNVGGAIFKVTAGFYEIKADKTFTHGLTVTYVENGQTVSEEDVGSGLWSLTGDIIRFGYASGALSDKGTIEGELLSMTTSDGTQLTFRR